MVKGLQMNMVTSVPLNKQGHINIFDNENTKIYDNENHQLKSGHRKM